MKKTNCYSVAIAFFAIIDTMLFILMILLATKRFSTTSAKQIKQEPVIKSVEVQEEQKNFDTSIIESQWCGGFEYGTVRMVGAWWYADGVVEDEQGQLWGIEQNIDKEDFLLLWIADNNTPDKTTDDIIIKVWREAY